ncbi:MAG: FAD:protein FMN transferase [Blastocatellia bacterium]
MSMACAWSILAWGADKTRLETAVEAAFDEIDRVDRLMSHYKPDSPLSRINLEAGAREAGAREAGVAPVITDPELFAFLRECLRYSRMSGGAFDITVGPLMKAWGFFRGEGRMPTATELDAARARIGYQRITLDPANQSVRFGTPGMELDLGGIAKGYAVDRAVAILKQHGVRRALINGCGSTIYGLGAPPGARAWQVSVADPRQAAKTAFRVPLRNRALSISGSSEKFFELNGVRYTHVMDPRTGMPVRDVISVLVLADSGTEGDALDNLFFVTGFKQGRVLTRAYPRAEPFLILPLSPSGAHARGWRLVSPAGKYPGFLPRRRL